MPPLVEITIFSSLYSLSTSTKFMKRFGLVFSVKYKIINIERKHKNAHLASYKKICIHQLLFKLTIKSSGPNLMYLVNTKKLYTVCSGTVSHLVYCRKIVRQINCNTPTKINPVNISLLNHNHSSLMNCYSLSSPDLWGPFFSEVDKWPLSFFPVEKKFLQCLLPSAV